MLLPLKHKKIWVMAGCVTKVTYPSNRYFCDQSGKPNHRGKRSHEQRRNDAVLPLVQSQ